MSFDASFDCERVFLMYLSPKVVKKLVSSTFVDSFKNFLSSCTNNKSQLGFVMLTGLPGEAVQSISVHAWSKIGCLAREPFGSRKVFLSIVFALCDNLLRLSSSGKFPQVCVYCHLSASLERLCDLVVALNIFSRVC